MVAGLQVVVHLELAVKQLPPTLHRRLALLPKVPCYHIQASTSHMPVFTESQTDQGSILKQVACSEPGLIRPFPGRDLCSVCWA
jgi:hypothetical protein